MIRRLSLALLLLLAMPAAATAGLAFTAQETPSFADTTCVSSKSSPTWDPSSLNGKLVLVAVYNSNTTTPPETVTLSGNGQTWNAVGSSITFHSTGVPASRLTLFRALLSGASSGTIDLAFNGAATQTGCAITVVSVTGMNTSGTNGSGAITNISTNTANNGVNSASLTMGSFTNSNNGTYAVFGLGGLNTTVTVKSGWTGGTERTYNSPASSLQAEWITSNDTTPNETFIGTADFGGIGVEIVAATPGVRRPQIIQ